MGNVLLLSKRNHVRRAANNVILPDRSPLCQAAN